VIEFVRRPPKGRLYSNTRRVRLSDAGPDGVLRLDGAARYLQDVASDDWAESGLDPRDTWVVRRTALRVADAGRWPALGEVVCLTTWCGGAGAAWAERRTDFEVEGRLRVEAVALWVSLDGSGRPSRLSKSFHDVYGEAIAARRVSGRVPAAPVPADATT
jgi:acyl-ACP thioesterase